MFLAPVTIGISLLLASQPQTPVAFAETQAQDAILPSPNGQVQLISGRIVGSLPIEGNTVGDLLTNASQPIFESDRVWPGLGAATTPGLSVLFDTATPFTIAIGNQRSSIRSHGVTVGEALANSGIYLLGLDYSLPAESSLLNANETIQVVRVQNRIQIDQKTTTFQTEWQANPDLEIDQTSVLREGQEGILCRRYKQTLINGVLQENRLEDEWVRQVPQDRIMTYGTKILTRPIDTPSGTQEYWRRLDVYVTAYSASTAGVSPSSKHYGLTRTGKRAENGIIAVDPSVIPLGTRIYVPGYGVGVAEDTGGGIIGKHIDVCYNDNELVSWHNWVTVYLLTPVPPESNIRWVLPNWPKR